MDTTLSGKNVSELWAKAFLALLAPCGMRGPVTLIVRGIAATGPTEDADLKLALDRLLTGEGQLTSEQVAFTIFPNDLYKIAGGDRQELFSLYRASFPHYVAQNKQLNRRGLYFERLVHFSRDEDHSNQLEWIIRQHTSRSGVRKSMYQASIFDPRRDHVPDAQLVFPCLQHVSFVPREGTLVMNAFYATQQFFNKAYGNYLGLARLAAFMAKEMGFAQADLQVYVGVPKLEKMTKSGTAAAQLKAACEKCLAVNTASAT